MIQVTVAKVGLDQEQDQALVLLSDLAKTTFIPIWIRSLEAAAIAIPLQGIVPPRPLTADLVLKVLEELDAEVVMTIITEIKDEVFHAHLVLTKGGREISIDCRPSDAIAIALRSEAPIYVDEKVLAEAGLSSEDSPVQ